MAKLLPSTSDPEPETEPRVIGVDSDEAGETLAALSSETAREMLQSLHDEPDTPSGIADRLDLTLQNVQYHVGNLDDAGLIDVVDTVYSEKGREMKVYGPADGPLVVYAGQESETTGLRDALKRLVGGVAVLGLVSLLVQAWLGELSLPFAQTGGAGDGAQVETTQDAATYTAESTAGLPPGLLFFLGGLVVLLGITAVWWWQREP